MRLFQFYTHQAESSASTLFFPAITLLVISACLCATGQEIPSIDSAKGLSPMASYGIGEIDNVNPVTGNVFLNIPLLSYPQRGHNLRLSFRIYYNDKNWFLMNWPVPPHRQGEPFPPSPFWTWLNNPSPVTTATNLGVYVARDQYLDIGQEDQVSSHGQDTGSGGWAITTDLISRFAREPNGAMHFVGDVQYQNCNHYGTGQCPTFTGYAGNDYPANDGTGFTQVPQVQGYGASMSGPDGVKYLLPASGSNALETIKDLNGNVITAAASGWTDTIGRQIPGSVSGPGTATGLIDPTNTYLWSTEPIPGVPTGPMSRSWTVPSVNGGTQTFIFQYSQISFATAFNLDQALNTQKYSAVGEASGSATVLSSITLPNGQNYEFHYDAYLSLTSLKLPTGAVVSYTWQNVVPVETAGDTRPLTRSLQTRSVDPGNGQPVRTWRYQWLRNPGDEYTTLSVVTDPALNDTERTLGPQGVTSVKIYQGKSPHSQIQISGQTTGVLLKEEDYTLTRSGSLVAGSPIAQAAVYDQSVVTRTDTFLPKSDGTSLQSSVISTPSPAYADCQVVSIPTGDYQTTASYYARKDCLKFNSTRSVETYDFGSGAAGNLLRSTIMTFKYETSTAYLQAGLMTLPDTVLTSGGSSTPVAAARTIYGYDESGSPGGLIGNQTSVTSGLGNDQVIARTQFNVQGMPIAITDGRGNTTSYQYDGTGLFLSSVTKPVTNGMNHVDQYAFDATTGRIKSHTDENQQTTTFSYTDPTTGVSDKLDRIRQIKYPATAAGIGSTTISYVDTPGSLSVTLTKLQDSSGTASSVTTSLDGLSDIIHVVSQSGDQDAIYTDTVYDTNGRPKCVTNPYRTGAVQQICTTYDALDRPLQITSPDNSTESWSYDANSVIYADGNLNMWKRTSDALGRLINVVEPNHLTTTYTYSGLGNLTAVHQSGLSNQNSSIPSGSPEFARDRTFTYNSLSQLIFSQNPETGTTCYGLTTDGAIPKQDGSNCATTNNYDGAGNLISKTDASGNTATYVYDALNRTISKSALLTSSATPMSTCFLYDALPGVGISNSSGRLATEWTQVGTCPSTLPAHGMLTQHIVQAYDALGRILSAQRCVLASCTSGVPFTFTQSYDLVGNLTSWTDGVNPYKYAQTFDGLARLGQVQRILASDPSNAVTLFLVGTDASAACDASGYSAAGSLQNWSLGNHLRLRRCYDSRLRPASTTAVTQ